MTWLEFGAGVLLVLLAVLLEAICDEWRDRRQRTKREALSQEWRRQGTQRRP